ncbi:unnamed protein product [Dicrocoelium dendriticum]|nr:unnamed protein product [Dicrocoelium dendriticum]
MQSDNSRRPQVENASHQTFGVSEIAIQADRDAEEERESEPKTKDFDFETPFLFSDAILIVQGRKLHCHRAILSIYSPVFTAMFRNRCLENQKNEVIIPGDSYDDVKEILLHMYTPGGREMSMESAQKLLPILHRYQIDTMVTMAERILTFRLTDSSAPMCLQVADLYNLTRLRQAALESCARLDLERLNKVFQECSLSVELRNEILQKRVTVLEKCLVDIQNSFTHSCSRVESRMERIPANHCQEHSRPMTTIRLTPITPPSRPLPPELFDGTAGAVPQSTTEVAASITPASVALGSIDMRPTAENLRQSSTDGNATLTSSFQISPEVTTSVVCEKCAEQLKSHIVELCKRGLHKIPIVMLRNT